MQKSTALIAILQCFNTIYFDHKLNIFISLKQNMKIKKWKLKSLNGKSKVRNGIAQFTIAYISIEVLIFIVDNQS